MQHVCKVKVAQSCLTLCHPLEFSRPEYWSGWPVPSPQDLPNPGIEPRSPTLQADSLAAEPPGKPKNTGVGSLSLLQPISPTQESNQGLLHYRQILYQLSYQGVTRKAFRKYWHQKSHSVWEMCNLTTKDWWEKNRETWWQVMHLLQEGVKWPTGIAPTALIKLHGHLNTKMCKNRVSLWLT